MLQISVTISPIHSPDGTVVGASKIARDISEQHRLRQEADEANRLKDEFLATLSHELRTPLNTVVGYSAMLRKGMMDLAQQEKAVDGEFAQRHRTEQPHERFAAAVAVDEVGGVAEDDQQGQHHPHQVEIVLAVSDRHVIPSALSVSNRKSYRIN